MAKRILFILALVFACISSHAKYTLPPYRQYTMRDGLPQMQIWSMFQDSRGYLWFGTKGGLSRFDGHNFVNFTEKDGLAENQIEQIAEDYSGKIWIVTRRGISVYNGQSITTYPFPIISLRIAPTPDGKIWYTGYSLKREPIFGYIENGKFVSVLENFPEFPKEIPIQIFYSESNNHLYLISNYQVYELYSQKLKLLLDQPNHLRAYKSGSEILLQAWDTKNNVNLYEFIGDSLIRVAQIYDGQLKRENKLRFSHQFFNWKIRTQIFIVDNDRFDIMDFPKQYLNVLLIDRDNRLWVGTEEGAIQCYSGGFETYNRETLPLIWSMVEDPKRNIWFASYNSGLIQFDGKTITNYPAKDLEKYGSFFYFQAQCDENGVLYFPNNFGIVYFDGQSFGAIKNDLCWASYYDPVRKILLGGYNKRVEAYDLQHKTIRIIGEQDGLPSISAIAAFGKDRHGFIWMGAYRGLLRYNWETREIKSYLKSTDNLKVQGATSIYTTPNGTTWFGGTQGLLWYDEKADSVRKIESDEITDIVNLVNSIDSTWLVFSQPSGIYLMNLKKWEQEKKVELTLFNEQNGFLGLEPGQNGAMKDSKGNIWMTTGTEVVKLNPKELDFSKNIINVRVSGLNGKPLFYTQKEITLPRNDRTAVIQFETISFNRPKAARFSWRIGGSKQDWSPWQTENYAVLTNLQDGHSVFEIKTLIPGLPNSETTSSIPITVNIALWKQEWFFPALLGLVSVLVLLSLILFIQTRTKLIQINKQAKMFQLQAILSQLNPHFIFNVMATLQSVILSANIQKANEYLVKMSGLIRGFLDASVSAGFSKSKRIEESELPLKKELEILDHFIQFQQLIYPERFDYKLSIGSEIVPEELTIPPMLIQPFVENSIKHGLLQKKEKGTLKISIYFSEKQVLVVEIEDNGIGIEKADALMKQSHLLYTSRGKELTIKRIKLLNEMGYFIRFRIDSSDSGTKVTLKIRHDAE